MWRRDPYSPPLLAERLLVGLFVFVGLAIAVQAVARAVQPLIVPIGTVAVLLLIASALFRSR